MFVFVCYYRVAGVQGREVLPPATTHKANATSCIRKIPRTLW